MKNSLVEKYTTARRTFKLSSGKGFYSVYVDGQLIGLIWNIKKKIAIDGDVVESSKFFARTEE